ncbi:transcriptional regulator, TraR/DksA family [Geodermatophilus telluris]|uniref:Transcriptional regulator, TraR/DksA family n=1 Tax=Geodermatophilus telluris TaxID=1190417 RepID=A0A1G6QHQ8_9ACTN|nr:TraR/DksA C4-type zinc finger protein [Geodermatophilus telluris]SDC92022.1 transcriptional regulator, TraR/DksA family [Geodermatophilus telluris]
MSTLTTEPTTAPTTVTAPTTGTATAHQRYLVLLQAQRADCVRRRELALAEAATSVPDPVTVRRAAHLLATIHEIDAAVERIADGSYGRCTHCGVDVPAERLEFRPFAAGCVACEASAH